MTERLYYGDSLLTEFDATVAFCGEDGGKRFCVLDRSAFYPTSGGQPYDTGYIITPEGEKIPVTDVTIAPDGNVRHTVTAEIAQGTRVHCVIDWERRRDHMEQHGGEHLLAGAVWRHFRGTTIGLHLGKEDSTIDVSFPDGRTHLAEDEITLLEEQVNAWIRMDAPVKCYFAAPEDLEHIPLRKPPTVTENIRIVQYGDFEYCACGGTHPPRSGMIGQIKILSALPSRGKVRFSFVCGERAEKLLREGWRILKNLSDTLSCRWTETREAVSLIRARNEELSRETEAKNELIAGAIAKDAALHPILYGNGGRLAFILLPFADKKFLPRFSSAEAKKNGMAVFCALKEEDGKSFFCMCRPEGVSLDLNRVIAMIGAKGGGRGEMVQGTADPGRLRERLEEALTEIGNA